MNGVLALAPTSPSRKQQWFRLLSFHGEADNLLQRLQNNNPEEGGRPTWIVRTDFDSQSTRTSYSSGRACYLSIKIKLPKPGENLTRTKSTVAHG